MPLFRGLGASWERVVGLELRRGTQCVLGLPEPSLFRSRDGLLCVVTRRPCSLDLPRAPVFVSPGVGVWTPFGEGPGARRRDQWTVPTTRRGRWDGSRHRTRNPGDSNGSRPVSGPPSPRSPSGHSRDPELPARRREQTDGRVPGVPPSTPRRPGKVLEGREGSWSAEVSG